MSSCERQQQKPGHIMEMDNDADGVAVLSAMDIPLDSQRIYTVGKCKICTVNSSDCGLIW